MKWENETILSGTAELKIMPTIGQLEDWNYSRDLEECIKHLSRVFSGPVDCELGYAWSHDPSNDKEVIWVDGICYPIEWFRITKLKSDTTTVYKP